MDLTTVRRGVMVPGGILLAMALSCRSDAKPPPADQQPRSRNYLGVISRDDADYGEFLRLDGPNSSAMYDGLKWVRLCGLRRHDSTVSFTTAEMFGRMTFEGVAAGDSLRGELSFRTATGTDRRLGAVVFRPLDDALPNHLVQRYGFYSDLQYIEGAGDNVGTQLLVASMSGRITVALAIHEGAVSSPVVGFNLEEIGDTIRFEVWRRTPAPTARSVFVNGHVEVSLSDWVAPPSRLQRKFSLQDFFEQPPVGQCTG